MPDTIQIHRLEGYDTMYESVVVTFDTRQHGYFQIEYDGEKLSQFKNEPNLMMFTDAERNYIECACALAHRIVFDSPWPDFE
jgi:hypothetical protein